MRKRITCRVLSFIMILSCVMMLHVSAFAAEGKQLIAGTLYEFDEDTNYVLSEATKQSTTTAANTYGSLSVSGDIAEKSTSSGAPSFKVDKGNLTITYTFTSEKLTAAADQWHIVDDKGKKIDSIILGEKILKGAIVVQSSKDRKSWITENSVQNAFADETATSVKLYTTKDIQQDNGCYFRIFVAYELERRAEQKNFLFIDISKYETKKYVEKYTFYVHNSSTGGTAADPNQTYSIGTAVRVDQFDGYWGEQPMKKDDPHYDVTLGQFFVSGYTDKTPDGDGNMVFLKNVGDKVTLWFHLNENIDGFAKNSKIRVTADESGSDQYFQTEPTNFGRGALIIKYTDYNNSSAKPQIYTNYLEANASVGADTTVRLCEEGDYEVALDYQLTEDKLIDSVSHYRIFFKFSIRNGNCMVYPFDLVTGDELTNSSMTENGFRLDLAKSRYLKVIVKREMLADSADGLVEDTRFNGPAKDGAEYKDEGIYTITVSNQYTGQLTEKKIYVGTNNVLRAYMTTGLSIPEINDLVAQGATINNDGTIQLAARTIDSVPDVIQPTVEDTEESADAISEVADALEFFPVDGDQTIVIGICCAAVLTGIVIGVIGAKRKKELARLVEIKRAEEQENAEHENEGSTVQ